MTFHETKVLEKEIAERKQAEDDLRRSEERYRELSEFLPIAIFETDNKGNIVYANKSAFQLTGYTQKNIDDGINILQIIASQDQDRALRMSQQVMQNRLTDGAEYLITKKDGSTCPGFINTRPTKKTTPGLIGYIFDMTGLKDAERALRESEEKYKDILESIEDGYYEVDLSGNFTFFNDSMRRILGYPADELLGMNNREYIVKKKTCSYLHIGIQERGWINPPLINFLILFLQRHDPRAGQALECTSFITLSPKP